MQKSIFSTLVISVIIIILLLAFPVSVFASETGDLPYEKFEKTYVLDDLKSAGMDIDEYISRHNDDINLISFQEFAYSYYSSNMSDFGLYVYIYNPSGKAILTESKSSMTIAVSYDADGKPNDYEKFNLVVCSRSTGEYSNLFYKFRIVDHISNAGSSRKQRVSKTSSERRYDVSEFELDFGNNNIEAYGVGGTFKFSGYAAGYGKDGETDTSTLICDVTDLITIELDVNQTSYIQETNNSSIKHHNQVTTAYFAVPNSILQEYGKLQKIKATWNEYRTTPIIVTDNSDFYNFMLPLLGVDIGNGHTDCSREYCFGIGRKAGGQYLLFDKAYNMQWQSGQEYDESITKISWLFDSEGFDVFDYTLTSDRISEYLYNYDGTQSDLLSENVGDGRSVYNLVDFDADKDAFDFTEYESDVNGLGQLWDYIFKDNPAILQDVAPIVPISSKEFSGTAESISERLLIGKDDVSAIKNYVANAESNGQTVFLFRFACTDYYSEEVNVYKYDNHWADGVPFNHTFNNMGLMDCAYVAQENVFLKFDIIQLTFNADGVYTVIPVVASPIDIIPSVTPPAEDPISEGLDKAKDFFEALWEKLQELWNKLTAALGPFIENWWKYVLLAIAVLAGFCSIPYIIRFIIWLIKLPFEAIEKSYKKKR